MAGKIKSRIAMAEKALEASMKLSGDVMQFVPRRYVEASPDSQLTRHPDFQMYFLAVALSVDLNDALTRIVDTLRGRACLPTLEVEAETPSEPDDACVVGELEALTKVRELAIEAAKTLGVYGVDATDMGPLPVGGHTRSQRVHGELHRASWAILALTDAELERLRRLPAPASEAPAPTLAGA